MPDDGDDEHIVLNFQSRPRSRRANGQKPPRDLEPGREDMITSGAVIAALVLAVAGVSGWVPIDRYTIGIIACLAIAAITAKLAKARRSKGSVSSLPRERK
jgi:hypothetical protein